MKTMANHSSARPHKTKSTDNLNLNSAPKNTISVAVKRRAQSLIKDRSMDAQSRAVIRYGLETNDPWVAELVRRADAGETVIDVIDFSQTPEKTNKDWIDEKIEALTEMICRAGDEPETKSAALLVLMAMIENATHPKALANTTKHLAFTRCGELNSHGMVDAQIAVLDGELFA